ncbi:MAG: DUF1761 domain-containing protein [Phototrophicaceae bacterium]
MTLPALNIFAIAIAALVEVIFSAMWFNAPFLFNKQWLAGIGKTAEQVAADASPISLVVAVIGAILTALILAIFIGWMAIDTWYGGILVGLLAAIGFSANTAIIKDGFERRPIGLTLINASHDLIILSIMGLIIALWQ